MIVSSQTCAVGSRYETYTYTEATDPQGWYLNLQLPANCSGNVTGYTAYYYWPFSNGLGDYTVDISMWTPTASGWYHKVTFHVVSL